MKTKADENDKIFDDDPIDTRPAKHADQITMHHNEDNAEETE